MVDRSSNSPEHNFIFVIVPREKLRSIFQSAGVDGGDILEMQVWRQYASKLEQYPGPPSIADAEQFAKALFLRWSWKWFGGDTPDCAFSRLVDQLIGGPRMTVETFDELWEMSTFHGFSCDCQTVFHRLVKEDPQNESHIRGMISEDAATDWIGHDRTP